MEVRVLGPLQVLEGDREVAIGGARERALLTALALGAGEAVSVDRLVDALWGEDPPRSATKVIQNQVLRLRKALGSAAILTTPGGYALADARQLVDAWRFEALVHDARASTAGGVAPTSLAVLDDALRLWRGRPFDELAAWEPAAAEAVRLEELRRLAEEDQLDARLASGEDAGCVPDLEGLVAAEPLREHRWAQLMVALYRSGRQADALRVFQRARETLGRELGVEPGAELRDIEAAVLAQDPKLARSGMGSLASGPELPSGIVTFLLTDIEGSTRLWEQHEEAMGRALAGHDALLREAVETHGGHVLKVTGDGLCAVFSVAAEAVTAACRGQALLGAQAWGATGPLRVRMGLHTGSAHERGDDYFGPVLNRAARLMAAAHGGQIVVSNVTAALARDTLGDDVEFIDLGEHRLRDLSRPLRVLQVASNGLLRDFPPLQTLPAPDGHATGTPLAGPLAVPTGSVFVGRTNERDQLVRALKDVTAGVRRVALMGGEPGIGKTSLAGWLAREAHGQGAMVLYGHCDEDLGIPYQPWREILGSLGSTAPDDWLRPLIERGVPELAPLAPDLVRRLGCERASVSSDPESERYLLFASVARMLGAVSSRAPVVLVLEDLHWADLPSLSLLRHVVTSIEPMRVLVVGTFRESHITVEHPMTDVLARLWSEPGTERISLTGLGEMELLELIEHTVGHELGEPAIALAHALYRETDGNPFFANEILRHLAETGAIDQNPDGHWVTTTELHQSGLPASVREVIGRRVARLGAEATTALTLAAVIGRDFDLDLLTAALDTNDEEWVLDLLDTAAAASLVTELTPNRFSFVHGLIDRTLYENLSLTRRARAHRRVAKAIETQPGGIDERLGELAYHWAEAASPQDANKAIDYARRAGHRALTQLAPDEALRWYRQALEFLNRQGPNNDGLRVELLVGLGDAQRQAGDQTHRETLLEAGRLAQAIGDTDRLVRAAATNTRGYYTTIGKLDTDRVELLEAACVAVGSAPGPDRAQLLALLAQELVFGGDATRRRALADEALTIARHLGDPAALVAVLNSRSSAIAEADTFAQLADESAEALQLAIKLGDPTLEFFAALARIRYAMRFGDLEASDQAAGIAAAIAERLAQPVLRWMVMTARSTREYLAGNLDAAEQLADQALQLGLETGQPDAPLSFVSARQQIRRAQGRVAEIVEGARQTAMEHPELPALRAALAADYCELGRHDDAIAVIAPDIADDFAGYPKNAVWLNAMMRCAEVAAQLKMTDPAARLLDRLAPYADQTDYLLVFTFGSVARVLGVLATSLGRHNEADTYFAQAAASHERLRAPYFLALTHQAWGQALSAPNRPGNHDRAYELLHQALATAQKNGYRTVERRARAALASSGST